MSTMSTTQSATGRGNPMSMAIVVTAVSFPAVSGSDRRDAFTSNTEWNDEIKVNLAPYAELQRGDRLEKPIPVD